MILTKRAVFWPRASACALLALTAVVAWAEPGQTPVSDLRVLIDVSGSMKHNDPGNLRAPALRLLTGLLPAGSQAGVWMFAGDVRMEVPYGSVGAQWKTQAREASGRIHSRGLFTDIERALREATFDWSGADPGRRRSLILLTDGMVDVSRGDESDRQSRSRIVQELLPRLRQAGAAVHTIALSGHADHRLLRRLAQNTDGWYERVDEAEQLNRVFLRLFEQSAPVDAVPLQDNRFQIDNSIRDMTVVVFRDAGEGATRILGPGGEAYTQERHPPQVAWHAEAGYDMVTVEAPPAGEWSIDGARDPDNRVLVVTNLKLEVARLPNHVVSDRAVDVTAHLSRDGEVLDDADFLRLTSFALRRVSPDGDEVSMALRDDGAGADASAGDGRFSARVQPGLAPGAYELIVQAQAKTFRREQRHLLRVHAAPATASVEAAQGGAYRLEVQADAELVQPDTVELNVRVGDTEIAAARVGDGRPVWQALIPQEHGGVEVTVHLQGKGPDGTPVSATLHRQLPGPAPVPSEEPAPPAEQVDWLRVTLTVSLVNLAVIGLLVGGYYGWRWWRGRPARGATEAPAEAEEAEEAEEAGPHG